MTKTVLMAGAALLSLALLVLWLAAAFNYGDNVATGRYSFSEPGTNSNLVLKVDHTFHQEVRTPSGEKVVNGEWRRIGEGGISFSKEFIPVPGVEVGPDDQVFAEMHKLLGLFVSLRFRKYYVLWYGRVPPSPAPGFEGTYEGDEEGSPSRLLIKADQSFEQQNTHHGITKSSTGQWKVDERGQIRFSSSFLKTSGEALTAQETAATENSGNGVLQIMIQIHTSTCEPTFRQRLLFWSGN